MSTTTPPQFKLHHKLALAFEESSLTVEEMAEKLGVSMNTVYNYMAGRTMPRVEAVARWAKACDLPLEWFTDTYTARYPRELVAA